MEIETLLHEEIVDEFKHLKGMDVGTDEYKTTVDGLTKLMDRAIEMEKLAKDGEVKSKDREFDTDLKMKQLEAQINSQKADFDLRLKQLNEDRKDRLVRNYVAVAGIVIPSVITIWGTIKSIEFEKEGTFTTIMGRGFISKLLPKK